MTHAVLIAIVLVIAAVTLVQGNWIATVIACLLAVVILLDKLIKRRN